MSYGSPVWSPWVREEAESIEQIKLAYQAGINFFDTADVYSNGLSEIILGKALKEIGAPRGRTRSILQNLKSFSASTNHY